MRRPLLPTATHTAPFSHHSTHLVLYASLFLNAAFFLIFLSTRLQSAKQVGDQDALELSKAVRTAELGLLELQTQAQVVTERMDAVQSRDGAQPSPAASSSEGLSVQRPWLTIGIPTFPRKEHQDYLSTTLSSLLDELPLDEADPFFGRVQVLIMNNQPAPGAHPVFEALRSRVANGDASEAFFAKAKQYVSFIDNPGRVLDPTPDAPEPDDFNNPDNRPGREVRRQTCNLIALLEAAQPWAHHYMFMEDDFRVCPNTLRILHYVLRKVGVVPATAQWKGLRFSYGMAGIILRGSDMPLFTTFLRDNTARLPPDLIWLDWVLGRRPPLRQALRGRPLAVYRYNLLDHIGVKSSFSVRVDRPSFPKCFDPMSEVWSINQKERFEAKQCPNSDISPCRGLPSSELWTQHPIEWPMDFPHEALEEDTRAALNASAPILHRLST